MDNGWEPIVLVFGSVFLENGTKAGPGKLVMRRKVDGEWRYRLPTVEETHELLDDCSELMR